MIRSVCTSRDSVLCAWALLLRHVVLSQKLRGTFFQESSRDFLIRVFCTVLSSELVNRKQKKTGMYITGFWTHYLLSNASVMGKTLLTNITRELAPEMRNSLP